LLRKIPSAITQKYSYKRRLLYVTAKRNVTTQFLEVFQRHLSRESLTLITNSNILPEDKTTLFVCSGMQQFKLKFSQPDNSETSTLQQCIRINDLDLIGDGSHLTSFQMLGTFSFGGNQYERWCLFWSDLIRELGLKPFITLHVHPTQMEHYKLWSGLGYPVQYDSSCNWSDGTIGGFCCELYYTNDVINNLEIGNLVHTLGHSVDVGFGLERLIQVLSNQPRVDETELFDTSLPPIIRDHSRTITHLLEHNVLPGPKGRNHVCQSLIRRSLRLDPTYQPNVWYGQQYNLLQKQGDTLKRLWHKHKEKSLEWWHESHGINPKDYPEITSI